MKPVDASESRGSPPERAEGALSDLMAALYGELRLIAARQLRKEPLRDSLGTTALVHEAYLRLAEQRGREWSSRADFCAAAAQAVRRVLIDHARKRARLKRRGTSGNRLQVMAAGLEVESRAVDLLDLDEALTKLAGLAPRQARLVELRYFGGLNEAEAAEVLEVSRRTVQEDWRGARAWLRRELARERVVRHEPREGR